MAASAPLVVTTRSRLRGRMHVPLMRTATRRIVRELHRTDGAERVVSLIAHPREFWSVSVWASRHTMQEFVRSGAHGTYLWEVGRWLESFWLMRWRPTGRELGTWDGATLAPDPQPEPPAPALDPAVREHILAAIPTLAQAFGPSGAPTYDSSPDVRWDRELVAGTSGLLVRVPRGPRGARAVAALRRRVGHAPDVLRVVTGRAQEGAGTFLLGLWEGRDGPERTLDDLAARAVPGAWACELAPEHEFGRWDALRVRDLGLFGALDPPDGHPPRPRPDGGHTPGPRPDGGPP